MISVLCYWNHHCTLLLFLILSFDDISALCFLFLSGVQRFEDKTSRPVPFLSSSEFAFVDIFGVNEDAEPGEKKARVREILLRWHPEDRESVREGVLWMSQRINELKNR